MKKLTDRKVINMSPTRTWRRRQKMIEDANYKEGLRQLNRGKWLGLLSAVFWIGLGAAVTWGILWLVYNLGIYLYAVG